MLCCTLQQPIIVAFLSSKRQKSALSHFNSSILFLNNPIVLSKWSQMTWCDQSDPPSCAFVDSGVKCWLYPHPPSSCMAHLTPQLPVGETRASGQGDVCYQPASSVTHAPACWTESVWARLCFGVSALRLLVSPQCVFVRKCVRARVYSDLWRYGCFLMWVEVTVWNMTENLIIRGSLRSRFISGCLNTTLWVLSQGQQR